MMPYQAFRQMSDEDVESVVAFLDFLPPVRNPLPKTILQFGPGQVGATTGRQSAPARLRQSQPGYGEYLVALGGCQDCHTPSDAHGQALPSRDFSGGQIFETPFGKR